MLVMHWKGQLLDSGHPLTVQLRLYFLHSLAVVDKESRLMMLTHT